MSSPPPSLPLTELVAHWGAPEFVSAGPVSAEDATNCDVGLIWKKRAVTVGAGREPCADVRAGKPLNPDWRVGQLFYASPDDALISAVPERDRDYPWPGFAQP
jgi:hypothetical protein